MYDVGLLLGGCGLYDGTETHEAVLALLSIDRRGWRARLLTVDEPQLHVVDHTTGNERDSERRNVMEESARLARGRVEALAGYDPERLDALVIPGGYGCAKNLMTGFAEPGVGRALQPDVARLLDHCLQARKPIGLIGLADLLIRALVPEAESSLAAVAAGPEPVIDADRRLVYTPGYGCHDRIAAVADGIDALIGAIARFLEEDE